MMKFIRWFLGKIILVLDRIFSPTPIERHYAAQAKIDAATAPLVLYQYQACPFCVKVRRAMRRMGLTIELRDAARVEAYRDELLMGGGKNQVPCLRVPEGNGFRWIYESNDIIDFLEKSYCR